MGKPTAIADDLRVIQALLGLARDRIDVVGGSDLRALGAVLYALNEGAGLVGNETEPFAIGVKMVKSDVLMRGYALLIGDTPIGLDGVVGWDGVLDSVNREGNGSQWESDQVQRMSFFDVSWMSGAAIMKVFTLGNELQSLAQSLQMQDQTPGCTKVPSGPRL